VPFCIAALLAAEIPSLPEEVRAEVTLHFNVLEDWLERTLKVGVRKHEIQLQSSAATEAQALMAVVHGAMLVARALGDPKAFHAIVQPAIRRLGTS